MIPTQQKCSTVHFHSSEKLFQTQILRLIGRKNDYEHINSGLSAALGYELGPHGVSIYSDPASENTPLYLRIEALRMVG
jgi:hypothetical protein